MRFDFINQAMKEVRYPHFFHCEPLTDSERRRVDALPNLPPSYVEFLETFGRARFFRELDQDKHRLFVFPPPEKLRFYGDSYMLDVAATTYSMPVALKLSELAHGAESPIYEIALGIAPDSPHRSADSFAQWLTNAWERSRRQYTQREWSRVLAGPVPFTEEEQKIVARRRGFSWRQLSPESGHIVIEFTNRSDGQLSRYTIGVKDTYGTRMTGALFVDVSRIAPGTTSVVRVPLGGYSQLLTPEISVLFDKGEPMPESRGDFCELTPVKDGTA